MRQRAAAGCAATAAAAAAAAAVGWWPERSDVFLLNGEGRAPLQVSEKWIGLVRKSLPRSSGYQEWEVSRIDERNNEYAYRHPAAEGAGWGQASTAVLLGLVGRVVFSGLNSLRVLDAEKLDSALRGKSKQRGLLTVSNHRSVIDDPLMISAVTPWWALVRPEYIRCGVCAADICFRSDIARRFMVLANVSPIVRRGGLAQRELQDLSDKLMKGAWVNYFPEGRVCQSGGIDMVRRGVGRLIEQATFGSGDLPTQPTVVAVYHQGSEGVIPQDPETHRMTSSVPKGGNVVFLIVGDPIDFSDIFGKFDGCLSQPSEERAVYAECTAMYDAIGERISLQLRMLRAELRHRVGKDHQKADLGDTFQVS